MRLHRTLLATLLLVPLATLALALGLVLVGATTTAAAADPPTGTPDQADQRKALYQSELERNLQLRNQAANKVSAEHGLLAARKALYQSELEHNLAAAAAADVAAPQPHPAAPSPHVDVLATLLIGLVGGLVGGAAAMVGWTATTRRRRPRAATGT